MKTRKEYFSKLKEKFSENNIEEYYELKEDLEEQIDYLIESGRTEEEAIEQLSDPEAIAKDYFEDMRFKVASEARYSVVPEEDIDEVYRENKRKLFMEKLVKVKDIICKLFKVASLFLLIYSVIYLIYELRVEKHIGRIPLLLIFLIGLLWINILKDKIKDKKILKSANIVVSILVLGLVAEGFLNNSLFYRGINHYEELYIEDYENINLNLESDYYIEFTTSKTTSNNNFSILMDGNYTRKDIGNFKENKNKKDINLEFGKRNLFNIFTKTNKPRLIIFVPEDMKFNKINFNIKDGDIRVLDLRSKESNFKTKEGDIFSKNIELDNMTINTEEGDITIENSHIKGSINNSKGKIILTNNRGASKINNDVGEVRINYNDFENIDVSTNSGRQVIEESKIKELETSSISGQIVVKEVEGNIDIENKSGKILAENNIGKVDTKNKDGITIFIDRENTEANIQSESGFIKWIHSEKYPIKIEAKSRTGNIQSELVSDEQANIKVFIESNTGDIRLIDKIE